MTSPPDPHPIFQHPLRAPLEAAVSAYLGRGWRAVQVADLSDLACHPSAILSDGSFSVFAKFSDLPGAAQQFEIEQAGLAYLADRAGVQVPTPMGVIPVDSGSLLLMEALVPVARGPSQWRQIGRTLACLHRVQSECCGFHQHNYFGPLHQDNTPVADWPTFYGQYRLQPRLKLAVDAGYLPPRLASQVENVIQRLPELCGPAVTPTLLHGDAQQNNFISTAQGTYLIDPAPHYGHPELDLAYVDYFQPVPAAVFEAYQAELPIDPGFRQRRDLWRISGYLAAVAVEGGVYVGMLEQALAPYR